MNNSKILCLSFAIYLAFKFPKAPSELGLVLFCLHTFLFNKKLISNVTYDAGRSIFEHKIAFWLLIK